MNTETQNQEEFIQNWYETAEYVLTNESNRLSKEEIDQLLAEATYNMTDEEAESFFKSLGGIVSKGLKVIAPIAKGLAPIVGTVAGAAIGGPIGAKLGGALGGAISNMGNKPQATNQPAQQAVANSNQRPVLGGALSTNQISQASQPQMAAPAINQSNTSHAPVANQLLMLINNPDFLIRLLRAVMPQNSTQRTRPTEDFIQDINDIKQLSEQLLSASFEDNYQDDFNTNDLHQEYPEAIDGYYDNVNEECYECAH
jgi:hypothetical protein|nr:hypothetical protein [uncultured Psychroserpens sp.]